MKIENNNFRFNKYNSNPQSFGSAQDITLKYVFEHRERLLPERIRRKVGILVSKGMMKPTLKELHLQAYSKLLDCQNLDQARNLYPEFREILQANAVIKKPSKNIKKIMEQIPLEDLSLHILKERWGRLKTSDELAQSLGVKDRSAIGWVMDKIQMPNLGKNYQILLKSSDETGSQAISQKVKAYHQAHPDLIIKHNREVSQNPRVIQIQREITQETWDRLPHIKAAFKNSVKEKGGFVSYGQFWAKYPEFAKEFGAMKRKVAAERKGYSS